MQEFGFSNWLRKDSGIESKGWRCGEEDACASEEDVCSGGSSRSVRPQSDSGEWIKGGAMWTENDTRWHTSGAISHENHCQQASVLQGACSPGVPVGIPAFHAPECCRTQKDFTLLSWYKASSGRSFTYFEVWQWTGKTAFLPPPASEIIKNHQIVKIWEI